MNEIINGWFSELCEMWPGATLSVEIEKTLYSNASEFQQIDVYQTKNLGVMLVLDGIIQCTEFDEFAYQEMLTHVAMFSHPQPEHVLVIGGGDGGILREITRHQCVKEVDICEIDEEVIKVSKEFLPLMACGFDDPRVRLHIADGNEFIKNRQSYYDIIIVDSTDPIGPAKALFEETFYRKLKTALRDDGIIATQAESFFMHREVVLKLIKIAAGLFPVYGYCCFYVPTYPGGNIGACLGSMKYPVKEPIRKPSAKMRSVLKYYSPEIHKASFILPAFAQKILEKKQT